MKSIKENCDSEFHALSGELGFTLDKENWRNLDVALYRRSLVEAGGLTFDKHYTSTPPEMVFKIDTKADLPELADKMSYFYTKTQKLLDAGVQKVIWIHTALRKHMVAEAGET